MGGHLSGSKWQLKLHGHGVRWASVFFGSLALEGELRKTGRGDGLGEGRCKGGRVKMTSKGGGEGGWREAGELGNVKPVL